MNVLDFLSYTLLGLFIVVAVMVMLTRKHLRSWKFGIFFEAKARKKENDEDTGSG